MTARCATGCWGPSSPSCSGGSSAGSHATTRWRRHYRQAGASDTGRFRTGDGRTPPGRDVVDAAVAIKRRERLLEDRRLAGGGIDIGIDRARLRSPSRSSRRRERRSRPRPDRASSTSRNRREANPGLRHQTYRTVAQTVGVAELHIHLLMNHSVVGVNAGYVNRNILLKDHLRQQQEMISCTVRRSPLAHASNPRITVRGEASPRSSA
jgi:hypothetical protein